MTNSILDHVLGPASIAIVGATDDVTKPAGRVQRYLHRYGFKGDVYPVNPGRESAQNVPTWPSVEATGTAVDLAVIAVTAAAVPAALTDCVRAGVHAAVVFSSGFNETGADGQRLEDELRRAIAGSSLRVIGPNCNGTIGVPSAATATFMTGLDQERFELRDDGVAFVTQSGAFGAFVFNLAQSTGLGIGIFLSTGNESDMPLPEVIGELVERDDVRVILGYLEGVRDGRQLTAALSAAEKAAIPVAIVKVGRTETGARAAASHTGALAGADRIYDGILRQFGACRVDSIERLLDVGRLLAMTRPRPEGRMTILTLSGGAGVLMADIGETRNLALAAWDEQWQTQLRAVLPPYASLGNPLDMTGTMVQDPTMLKHAIEIANQHPGTDIIVVLLGNLEMQEEPVVSVLQEANERIGKPLVVTWVGGSGRPAQKLNAAGIPTFSDPNRTVLAIAEAVAWARHQQTVSAEPDVAHPAVAGVPSRQPEITIPARVIGEHQSKQILAAHGFPVIEEALAQQPDQAVAHADELGYPVVAKLQALDLTHKTELRAVRTGLDSPTAVHRAATGLLQLGSQHELTDPRVLIQQQADGHVEVLIGMSRDDTFGPVVTVGIGGVFAELLDDVAVLIPPLRPHDVDRALAHLRGAHLLTGFRGRPPVDSDALCNAVCRFGEFVVAHSEFLAEVDLNPVIAGGNRIPLAAVDALIIGREPEAS